MRQRVMSWAVAGLVVLGRPEAAAAQASSGAETTDSPAPASSEVLELGRRYTTWFYADSLDRLWPVFSPELGAAIGGEAGLRAFRAQVGAQLGAERRVVDERVTEDGPARTYVRQAEFENYGSVVEVAWALGDGGVVHGFWVRPRREAAPSRFLEYETKTPLRLPFDGEWAVYWGGRTVEQNYHAVAVDQRFAYDLVVVRDGRTHTGDGTRNEDYHCYGLSILAPGAGVVAVAVDGIQDNRPGVMNASEPPGNYVVLDHGNGEYSFLAHLRKDSVRVRAGDRVSAGNVVGECGNSGNSSEPHLHYHLQTTPVFGRGEGLPAQFRGYVADGEPVERGEPVRGQRIRPGGG
jgi:murein DD-endopeptidase MepM/ murein hydrolase activator NlpD